MADSSVNRDAYPGGGAESGGPGGPESERFYAPEPGMTLLDYIRIIRERLWILVICLFVAITASVIYCIKATPLYVAVAQLELLANPPKVADIRGSVPDVPEQQFEQFFISQLRILQSTSLADRILDDPAVQASVKRYRTLYPHIDKSLLDRLRRRFGGERGVTGPEAQRARDLALIRSSLNVRRVVESNLVNVHGEAADPQFSSTIANALVDQFVAENLEARVDRASEGLSWLASMATNLEAQVAAREMALENLKAERETISLEDRKDIVLQELRQLNSQVTSARGSLLEKENTYNELSRLLATGEGLDSLPASVAGANVIAGLRARINDRETALARLRERYLARHPDVTEAEAELEDLRAQMRDEGDKLLQRARADYELARSREDKLNRELRDVERKAMDIDRQRIEFNILERQATTLDALYSGILKRLEESAVAAEMEANNIRVVSEARPPARPAKPDRPRIVLASTGVGVLMGFGLIFLLNAFDDRIKSQEDIETVLSVPFLGLVPLIEEKRGIDRDRVVHDDPKSTTSEAFRTLRAALGFGEGDHSNRLLAITSAGPSEGKSLISSNLAIAYAQSGARTLLIDADLRRPSIHKAFDVDRDTGLSDYLEGLKALKDVTRPAPDIDGLDLCTVGHTVPNPAELLASPAMARLIQEAAAAYDRVIFDTPPISAVADSLIIGRQVDSVVVVVQFARVRKRLVVRTVNRLIDARARIAGAVLNRINVGSGAYYYYYAYYHDSYYGDSGRRKKRRRSRSRGGRRSSSDSERSPAPAESAPGSS